MFLGPRGPLVPPGPVAGWTRAKNLDQLYSSIYASQTHITIHIPKAHDKYYPLTPRDDNDKYTRKDKDKAALWKNAFICFGVKNPTYHPFFGTSNDLGRCAKSLDLETNMFSSTFID